MPGTGGDPISQLMQMIGAQPQLIVCGRLGLEPLTDDQRHGLLANVNIFDALETVARLQGRWDDQLTARGASHSGATSNRHTGATSS
jgi:hypothetical protein